MSGPQARAGQRMRDTPRKRQQSERSVLHEALSAARETRAIEFKETFDPANRRSLCETLKDILAFGEHRRGCDSRRRR